MATVSAGQSIQLNIGAFEGLWVNCTGVGFIDFECKSRGTIQLTNEYQRIGFYGDDICVELRCVSGVLDYSTTPVAFESLKAIQGGDRNDSSPLDIKLAVNGVSEYVNSKGLGSKAPWLSADFSNANLDDFTIDAGTPDIAVIETDPVTGRLGLHIKTKPGEFTGIVLPQMASMLYQRQVYLVSRETPQTVRQRITFRVTESGSNFWNHFAEYGAPSLNNPNTQGGSVTRIYNETDRSANATPPAGDFYASSYRIQIQPDAGQVIETWIFGVGLGRVKKGRIAVVWDDNRASALKLGVPILEQKGIKQTIALISSTVGNNTFGSLSQLRSFVAGGNAVVSHGVNGVSDGAGSLITQYGTNYAAAVDDIFMGINYIRNNGLYTKGAEKCYVYPQGAYQTAVNNTGLLDAMLSRGLTTGRISFRLGVKEQKIVDSLARYNRLCAPTIGHEWAGTTAAEATNIANVVTNIQQCALRGLDCYLMLHTVVSTATADGSMTQYDIRAGDLTTLADAIKAEVDAGRLETVTMPDYAITGDNYWNQF